MAWTSPICRNAYRMPIISVDDLQRRAETVDCRSGSANGMIFYPQSAPHSTHLTAKANGCSSVPATQTPPRRRLIYQTAAERINDARRHLAESWNKLQDRRCL